MVRLISYPFRLGSDGSIVTLEEGVDYYADELAMLIKTVPGERELVPEYGIQDPTFGRLNEVQLIEKVSVFGPPVDILEVTSRHISESQLNIQIVYDQAAITDGDITDYDEDVDDYYSDEYDENNPEYNFLGSTDV